MRNFVIVVMLLLSVAEAMAQGQAPREEAKGRSYFGAPVVKYTVARDQGAVMFGGRGGVKVTPSLMLGGSAYGTMTEIDGPKGAIPEAPGPLYVKFETFAFDLEYATPPTAPTHLTLGASLGGVAVHYMQEENHEQYGETDFALLLEPAVGVEQRVNDWLHLNLAVSYRLVSGVEQPGLENGDISGVAAALAVKLGRF
jgi:hypothetical protein